MSPNIAIETDAIIGHYADNFHKNFNSSPIPTFDWYCKNIEDHTNSIYLISFLTVMLITHSPIY